MDNGKKDHVLLYNQALNRQKLLTSPCVVVKKRRLHDRVRLWNIGGDVRDFDLRDDWGLMLVGESDEER